MIHGLLNPQMQKLGYGGLTLGLDYPQICISTVGPGTRNDCTHPDHWENYWTHCTILYPSLLLNLSFRSQMSYTFYQEPTRGCLRCLPCVPLIFSPTSLSCVTSWGVHNVDQLSAPWGWKSGHTLIIRALYSNHLAYKWHLENISYANMCLIIITLNLWKTEARNNIHRGFHEGCTTHLFNQYFSDLAIQILLNLWWNYSPVNPKLKIF